MEFTRLTDDEIRSLEASGWVRCRNPHCIYESAHWHDEDGEKTTFLVAMCWSRP